MSVAAVPVRRLAPTPPAPGNLLVWRKAVVDSRPALYGEAGEGIPVLFLHGWALGHHSYKPALKRLIGLGCHVWAPALPGFGGTPELPTSHFSFAGYAGWVERFCEVVGIEGSVVVVGHSFGGGVGIQLTHDVPDRVKQLVLLNSVGGQAWLPDRNRSMAERPLWDWGLHFPGDVLALSKLTRMVPVFLEDAIPNVVRSPRALWRVAQLARKADLTEELRDLQARDAKVTVLWSDKDEIIPRASFEDLCAALGIEGEVIPGSHSWLLADPGAFAEIMSRVLGLEAGARQSAGPPAAG